MNKRLNVVPYDAGLQKLASSFHSGNDFLDRFLNGSLALDANIGKTFVFLSEDDKTIIGYYNLGLGYIEQNDFGIRKKAGGAVHINSFALDEKYHGLLQANTEDGMKINLSDILLDNCMEKIEEIREKYAGFTFVTLCSTQQGYSLYSRNGFDNLEEDMSFAIEDSDIECIPMYLPMDIQ